MAFLKTGLKRVDHLGEIGTGVNSIKYLYTYHTLDAAAVVEAASYFAVAFPGAPNWNVGDIIIAVMAMGGTPVMKHYVVTAVSAANTPTIALQTTTAG